MTSKWISWCTNVVDCAVVDWAALTTEPDDFFQTQWQVQLTFLPTSFFFLTGPHPPFKTTQPTQLHTEEIVGKTGSNMIHHDEMKNKKSGSFPISSSTGSCWKELVDFLFFYSQVSWQSHTPTRERQPETCQLRCSSTQRRPNGAKPPTWDSQAHPRMRRSVEGAMVADAAEDERSGREKGKRKKRVEGKEEGRKQRKGRMEGRKGKRGMQEGRMRRRESGEEKDGRMGKNEEKKIGREKRERE